MKHGLVPFAFAGAPGTAFLVAWIIAVATLDQDACLDRGGVVTDAGYACRLPDGALLTVTSLISRWVVGFAALVAGAPLLLLWLALRGRFCRAAAEDDAGVAVAPATGASTGAGPVRH